MIHEINKWGTLCLLFFIIPLLSHEWMGEHFQLFNWVLLKLFAAQLMYGVGFVLLCYQLCVQKSVTIKTNSVHVCVLTFLFVLTLFTVLSKYPHTSTPELIMFMTFFAGYFVTSQVVESKRDLMVVLFLIMGSSVIVMLYGWYQCKWGWKGVPNSTIGNKNFFANYLTLNIFPVGALLVTSLLKPLGYYAPLNKSKGSVVADIRCSIGKNQIVSVSIFFVTLVSVALMGIGIFLADSLGAYVGFLAGLLSLSFMMVRGFKRKLFLIAIVLLFFVALFYLVPAVKLIINGERIRLLLWKSSWLMFKANFWKGPGPGTFFIYFPQYRIPEYFAVTKGAFTASRHAHNELLQIGGEVGIWGVVAFLAIFVVLFWKLSEIVEKHYQSTLPLIDKVKNEEKKYEETDGSIVIWQLGLFGGIVGVLVHDMFSVDLRFPSMGIPFWANLGLLVGSMQIIKPCVKTIHMKGIRRIVFTRLSTLVIVTACGIFFAYSKSIIFHPFMAERNFYMGVTEKSRRNIPVSTEYFMKALKHDPYNQPVLYRLAHNYGLMGDFQNSLKTYLRLAELAPNYSRLQSNIGKIYILMGNFPEAIINLRQALIMNPFDAEDHMGLFKAYQSLRMSNEAKKELEIAMRLEPDNLKFKMVYDKYIK